MKMNKEVYIKASQLKKEVYYKAINNKHLLSNEDNYRAKNN